MQTDVSQSFACASSGAIQRSHCEEWLKKLETQGRFFSPGKTARLQFHRVQANQNIYTEAKPEVSSSLFLLLVVVDMEAIASLQP